MQRRRIAALLAPALVVTAVVWLRYTPGLPAAPPEVLRALGDAALPIRTAEPGDDHDDLRPLLPHLATRRIVALGEATHGTREFFQMKHRLVQLLVHEAGFRTLAIETDPDRARRVDAWVQHGEGDAETALHGLEFWTWKTEEVLALVRWMRDWNLSHPAETVAFVGINSTATPRDRHMAGNVEQTLQDAGAEAKLIVWAHNAHVAAHPGWMGDYLRRRHGRDLYLVGFEFATGAFRSRNLFGLRDHAVGNLGAGYYAHALAQLPSPLLFLDFAGAVRDPALARWLAEPRRSRDIDELFYVRRAAERFYSRTDPWLDLYDAIVFVRHSTAARGLVRMQAHR